MKRTVVVGTALVLLTACEIFAVRMPTRTSAGGTFTIQVDVRTPQAATNKVLTECNLLPNGWSVTSATFSRTLSGVTSTGTLVADSGQAATLNGGPDAVSGSTWGCYSFSQTTYAANDYGTAIFSVSVGAAAAAGDYELRFGITDGSGTLAYNKAYRRITVDSLPDWRYDSRPIGNVTQLDSWSGVIATSASAFATVDKTGSAHFSTNAGGTWSDVVVSDGQQFNGLARIAGRYVAVGTGGVIYTTTSASSAWAPATSGAAQDSGAVCTDNSTIVAVGKAATVITSSNGTAWTAYTVDAGAGNVRDCVAVPGYGYYAITDAGKGFAITPGAPPLGGVVIDTLTATPLGAIATDGTSLFAFGAGVAFKRAASGGGWTSFASPTTLAIARARVINDQLYALNGSSDSNVDDGGLYATSLAGAPSWVNLGSGTTMALLDVAASAQAIVMVGDNGARLRIGAPALSFASSTLDLPHTDLGVLVSATVGIINTGSGVLQLGAITVSSPFTATAPCAGGSLDAGASCTITVSYTPLVAGLLDGTLSVANNGVAPATLSITGNGGSFAGLVVTNDAGSTPLQLDFGTVAVGTTATHVVTLRDGGDQPLIIGSIGALIALAPPFASSSDGCSGHTLVAGASCTVTVTFAPTSATSYAQAFDIPSNDSLHPSVNVQVSGSGALASDIDVASSIAFADTAVGDSSEQTLTVRNIGNGPLTISGITPSDAQYVADPTSFSVSAGATATVTLRFTPSAAGDHPATLLIASNDPDEGSVSVALTGTGTSGSATKSDGGCQQTPVSCFTLLLSVVGLVRAARRMRG